MFIVKSYVLKPEKIHSDLSGLTNNPNDFFIEISEINNKISKSLHFRPLEGAIKIQYGKEILLDLIHWDFVNGLWHSLLNLVENIQSNGEGLAYFPDSALEIHLTKKHNDVMLYSLIGSKTYKTTTLPKKEFLNALLDGAEYFFKTLMKYEPEYKYGLERAKELRAKLK